MTSTDLRVANGPLEVVRRLSIRSMVVALALAIAALAYTAAPGFAEEPATPAASAVTTTETTTSSTETGYNQKPEVKEKEGAGYNQKPEVPKKEVAPAKEEVEPKPAVEPEPSEEEAVPTPVSEPVEPETTLPFTGYDLRWVVGAGLLLIAGGALSLMLIRRRERHGNR